jgi:hypothetical protein
MNGAATMVPEGIALLVKNIAKIVLAEPETSIADSPDSCEQVNNHGLTHSRDGASTQDFSERLIDDLYTTAEDVIGQAFTEPNRLPLMVRAPINY